MIKVHVLCYWLHTNITLLALHPGPATAGLTNLEASRTMGLLWCQQEYLGSILRTPHWLWPPVCYNHLVFLTSDNSVEKLCPQNLLRYFWKTVCGLGRILHLCRDQSLPLCFLEKLKVLFANWPHSSECQLHRYKIKQKFIKSWCGFIDWNRVL